VARTRYELLFGSPYPANTRSVNDHRPIGLIFPPFIEHLYAIPWHSDASKHAFGDGRRVATTDETTDETTHRPVASGRLEWSKVMGQHQLTDRQRSILEFIESQMRERGFPPSVREIGAEVGLTSPSSVHAHLATLQRCGYLQRDPSKPRAITVSWDATSGAVDVERRPVRHVPLVGQVAAGTDVLATEHIEETLPVPADLTGDGDLFMLTVRGDSMIEAGILDGDFVVARVQPTAELGDIVVAGIPGEEATVKTLAAGTRGKTELRPANATMGPMIFDADDVTIFGKVVTVMRRL
jgi:repressor LexA